MSDQSDALETEGTQAAESAETAQGAVDTEGSSPPWGDDFDPQRAYDSLQAARKTEKELKERLRQAESVWEDEQALRDRLQAQGYVFEEDDTEDENLYDDEDTEPADPRVEQHDQWIQQQQERQVLKEFNDDLEAAAKDANVKLTDRERRGILQESLANGFTPEATREALTGLIEDRKALRESWQAELKASKQAPHVPSSGQAATQTPDLDDDQTRRAWMAERYRALNEG